MPPNRRTSLRFLLAIALASSCGISLDRAANEQALSSDVRLRLVAANLTSENLQSYDPGEGIRILRGLHADVVLVQEFQYSAGIQQFADTVCGAPCYVARESAQLSNGIVSRYPIKSSGRWVDASVSNRGFAWAQIDIPGGKDLWAVSVHLLTNTSPHAAEASQLVQYIQQNVPAGDYLVIGGDFNSPTRTDAAVTGLAPVVVTNITPPTDQNGNSNTNAGRTKPYDWVLVNAGLNALQTSTTFAVDTFASGLVADTRVYTPLSDLSPAQASDSGAPSMQHMAVIRDFLVPGDAPPTGGSVIVTSPNGGESWSAGSSHAITWTSSNVAGVKIEYSSDGGATWSVVSASTAASAGTFSWVVPSTATTSGKVRISDASNASMSDTSNAPFTVVAAPPGSDAYEPDDSSAAARPFTLGTPQTHSILPASDQDWVTFTLASAANVRIETSGPSGGDTFVRLYNAGQTQLAFDDDSGIGYYSLLLRPSLPAGTYYLKVTSYLGYSTITGYSLSISTY